MNELSLTKNFVLTTSRVNHKGVLDIDGCMDLFMDIATEHAKEIGIGLKVQEEKDQFWVAVRSKIRIYSKPYLEDNLTLTTWPAVPEKILCPRYYELCDEKGETLIDGRTDWSIIHKSTGHLSRDRNIYPEDSVYKKPLEFSDFDKSKFENCSELLGTYKVKIGDIDIGGHMNNVAYLRALKSLFSCFEWDNLSIKELEIQYKKACHEMDLLNFFVQKENHELFVKIMNENELAATIKLLLY